MYSTCDHNRCANEDRYRTVCTFYVKEEKIGANTVAKSRFQRVTFLNTACEPLQDIALSSFLRLLLTSRVPSSENLALVIAIFTLKSYLQNAKCTKKIKISDYFTNILRVQSAFIIE